MHETLTEGNNDIFHEDEFIRDFVPDVMRELRIQYVRDQVLLYRVLDWQHLAEVRIQILT